MDTPLDEWMTAADAAARLGVSRQTLYAYVSRGHLRAHKTGSGTTRRYRRSDVERLVARHAAARQPRQAAGQTLDWGLPVLQSQLTLIDRGRLSYRGQDAVTWSLTATLEDTAALLWGCDAGHAFSRPCPRVPAAVRAAWRRHADQPLPGRLLADWTALLPVPVVDGPRPAQAGSLLRLMGLACTQGADAARTASRPLHQQLRRAWQLDAAADDTLRRALVLCADHELNASSFTARCVAATGAGLDACVTAGLAALSGPRHGGMTGRVEALWPQVQRATGSARTLRRALADEVQRRLAQRRQRGLGRVAGDLIAGFGHPLYPDGDPRARALLDLLPPQAARDRFVQIVQDLTGQPPALDFALVALRRSLGAPDGAAFVLFALARTAGWIAHAIEQQDSGLLIRPRAAYTGPPPERPAAPPRGRVVRRR